MTDNFYRFNKNREAVLDKVSSEDRCDMEPFLKSTNIQNVYAEPLRDMKTIKTLIVIALFDQQYETAFKWITVQFHLYFLAFVLIFGSELIVFISLVVKQAMTICTQQQLQCKLYMDMAFVLSQEGMSTAHSVTPQYCVREALSIKETKKMYVICPKVYSQ